MTLRPTGIVVGRRASRWRRPSPCRRRRRARYAGARRRAAGRRPRATAAQVRAARRPSGARAPRRGARSCRGPASRSARSARSRQSLGQAWVPPTSADRQAGTGHRPRGDRRRSPDTDRPATGATHERGNAGTWNGPLRRRSVRFHWRTAFHAPARHPGSGGAHALPLTVAGAPARQHLPGDRRPTEASVLDLLSVGAAHGVLVLVFQDGHGERLLNFLSVRESGIQGAMPPTPSRTASRSLPPDRRRWTPAAVRRRVGWSGLNPGPPAVRRPRPGRKERP